MTAFAKGTGVPVARSRGEIQALLEKWKATKIGMLTEHGRAHVMFSIGPWSVKFSMPLPTEEEAATLEDRYGKSASLTAQKRWLEQTQREKWRALLLTIKAKLVSVENGVETFEEAFLAHLVLADGHTVGQKYLPPLRSEKALPEGRA